MGALGGSAYELLTGVQGLLRSDTASDRGSKRYDDAELAAASITCSAGFWSVTAAGGVAGQAAGMWRIEEIALLKLTLATTLQPACRRRCSQEDAARRDEERSHCAIQFGSRPEMMKRSTDAMLAPRRLQLLRKSWKKPRM